MPLIDDPEAAGFINMPPLPVLENAPPKEPGVTYAEPGDGGQPITDLFTDPWNYRPLQAAMEQMNPWVSMRAAQATQFDNEPYDPEFDLGAALKGTVYENTPHVFAEARNQQHFDAIMSDIMREEGNRQVLDHASTPAQIATGLMAVASDPVSWVGPGGVALAKAGGMAMRASTRAGLTAAAVGVDTAIQETMLHSSQQTRTMTESAVNVGGSMILGGILGYGIGALIDAGEARLLSQGLEDAVKVAPDSGRDGLGMGGFSTVGAARVGADIPPVQLDSALGVEKVMKFQDPTLRTLQSPLRTVREAGVGLFETVLGLTRNADGVTTAPIGGAVETRIKTMGMAKLGEAIRELDQQFSLYQFAKPAIAFASLRAAINPRGKLTAKQFKVEVGKAMAANDQHAIPQVAAAAKAIRAKLIDPLAAEAVAMGLLPETVLAKGGVKAKPSLAARVWGDDGEGSYITRIYNKQKIQAQTPRFRAIITNYLEESQTRANAVLEGLQEQARQYRAKAKAAAAAKPKPDPAASAAAPAADEGLQGFTTAKGEPVTVKDLRLERARGETKYVMSAEAASDPDPYTPFTRMAASLPDDINDRFQVHGLMSGNRDENLLNLLEMDIDPTKPFNSGPPKGGLNGVDSTRSMAPYLIISDEGKTLLETGVKNVVLNGPAEALKGKLQAAYPNVNFMTVAEADAFMRTGKLPPRPRPAGAKTGEKAAKGAKEAGKADDAAKTAGAADSAAAKAAPEPEIPDELQRQIDDLFEFTGLERGDLETSADRIINTIIGAPEGRMLFDLPSTVRGPLAERTLRIKDEVIEDFLERDVEVIARYYMRTMTPDIEMKRMFGSIDMAETFAKINDETGERLAKATTDAERTQIHKDRAAAFRDLSAIADRLRGTYALPEDPTAWLPRAARTVRSLNYLRLLGGMTLSALPDTMRAMMVHGVTSYFKDGFVPLMTNLKGLKLAGDEVKLAGTALDMILDTRAMAMADILDDFGRYSKFERAIQSVQENFGVISLMAPWNAAVKQWSGAITMTNILRSAKAVKGGTADAAIIRKLAQSSIDDETAGVIAEQFAKHGSQDRGVWLPNTTAWDIEEPRVRRALEAFRAAVVRDVDRIIITPGQDKPLWMSTELGKMIGQFKSFGVASVQRTMIAGLQERDAGVFCGMMGMIGLGAAAFALKAQVAGRELPDDPAAWAKNAIDMSGVTGWLFEVNNFAEQATGGVVGLSGALRAAGVEKGNAPMARYASRNWADAVFGPTGGMIKDAFSVTQGAARSLAYGEQVQEADIRALRRMLPFQNIFYASWLFRRMEQGVSKALNAKPVGAKK
jgi:hypothetical protein